MKLRRYKITSKEIDNGKSIIRVWALDEVDALMRVFPSEWPELHATLEFLPDIERVNGIKNV
jgi:hypothetical protein